MAKKRFTIMVFDNDLQDDGRYARKPRDKQVVEGSSRAEIAQLFAMCDQSVEFLSEEDIDQQQQTQKQPKQPTVTAKENKQNDDEVIELELEKKDEQHFVAKKPKPKIVTIGDIQIKYDGEKIYQKQWVKLSEQEASNIRVVSDKNNSLVSLTGKHIEMKKWVLIENTDDEECTQEEGYSK